MNIADFALERYFARWEFSARYLLCASDIESYGLAELLTLADDEARASWDGLRLGYTESAGHPLLRREIASLYDGIAPEEVLVFAGAEEAIFLTMHARLAAGDHAVVTWPAYQSLFEVARSAGADVTLLPLDPADWSLDVDRVRAELRPNTKVVVVNFPHSPTGALMERDAYRQLVALTEERGIALFSDEVYRWLEIDESCRLPAAAELGRHTLSLGVMSKSFALAGLRIGWLATHDAALLRKVAALKDYTTICSSAPSEMLAMIALRARDQVLARSRSILARNLPLLDAFFERMADEFAWVRPRAGSVAFPRMRRGDAAALEQFAARLVEEEGVLLLPGSQFGYPGSHFRLGFGRRDLPVALERLEAFATRVLA